MISIVTINYNNLIGLKETVRSVCSQSFIDFEHIIVDGNSSDGSKEFLYSNSKFFSKLIIENDNGIYDAMNKGIKCAKGEFLIFLNSGDMFYNNTVLSSIDFHSLSGKLIFGQSINSKGLLYPKKFSKNWLRYSLPNHQAMFFPREFYSSNFYNTKFKIVGDSDYKFRAFGSERYVFLNQVICEFNLEGVSNDYSSFNNFRTIFIESLRIGYKYRGFDYLLLKIIVHISKFLRSKI